MRPWTYPFRGQSIINALVHLCINSHTTFEVFSFTDSKDMNIGVWQTDGQTDDDSVYRACIASRGKNYKTVQSRTALATWALKIWECLENFGIN